MREGPLRRGHKHQGNAPIQQEVILRLSPKPWAPSVDPGAPSTSYWAAATERKLLEKEETPLLFTLCTCYGNLV